MAQLLFNRYIWLIDYIRRRGRVTRSRLNDAWIRSPFSDGAPLPRRTFYNYRQSIAELFNIEIGFDPSTYEYYIAEEGPRQSEMTDWLLNSASMNDTLSNAREVASKIFVEEVPSARDFLNPAIEALKTNHLLRFDYLPYTRTIPTRGIEMRPYFLKIFRQRWYLTGLVTAEKKVKTYALDRMSEMLIMPETFEPDPTFDPEEYTRYSFGIMFNESTPRRIALKVPVKEAKYIRALPLHKSQSEVIHDGYSIFYYTMRLTADLVQEILSRGSAVEVLEPRELRAMVRAELRAALDKYEE